MKLHDWIEENGEKRIAARLKVSQCCLSYWLNGKSTPQWPTMLKILEMSKGKVTIKEVIEVTQARKRANVKKRAK